MKKFLAVLFLPLVMILLACPAAIAQVNSPFPYRASALTNTVVQPKLARGVFQWGSCYNPNASVEYIQVFDTAGTVTLGTTVPTMAIPLVASTVTQLPFPALMLNGLQLAAATTATGNTAPGSALVCNFGFN